MYNFSVAREFLKHIYVAERLQPPSLSTVQSAYSTIWSRASSPAYWKEIFRTGEYAKLGIYAVEAYGIFKVSSTFLPFPRYPDCRHPHRALLTSRVRLERSLVGEAL